MTLFKIVAGLPQTKGGTKLKNLEGTTPKGRLPAFITALHAAGLTTSAYLQLVAYARRDK